MACGSADRARHRRTSARFRTPAASRAIAPVRAPSGSWPGCPTGRAHQAARARSVSETDDLPSASSAKSGPILHPTRHGGITPYPASSPSRRTARAVLPVCVTQCRTNRRRSSGKKAASYSRSSGVACPTGLSDAPPESGPLASARDTLIAHVVPGEFESALAIAVLLRHHPVESDGSSGEPLHGRSSKRDAITSLPELRLHDVEADEPEVHAVPHCGDHGDGLRFEQA